MLGSMSWAEWKKINEDIIRLIRSFDTETIPLVAGFDWAYDLTHLNFDPLDSEGIGYVTHPYPWKRNKPWPSRWDENFGFAASKWPIMASELGFNQEALVQEGKEDYGEIIIPYLEERGISWVAWVYDPEWHPQMLKSWDTYELTPCGEFFRKAMQGELDK